MMSEMGLGDNDWKEADFTVLIQDPTSGRRAGGERATIDGSKRHKSNRPLSNGHITSLFTSLNVRETDSAVHQFSVDLHTLRLNRDTLRYGSIRIWAKRDITLLARLPS